ncbi:Putative ribonuclease H protein At1g65750 [Linum grandiflorum]
MLSHFGKLQLVKSVLQSMATYWMSIFVLPQSIIKQVEAICSQFVWNTEEKGEKRARVSWRNLSFPIREGGVGIRDLRWWNVACVSRHLWNLLLCSGSIWVAWNTLYRLRGDIWGHTSPKAASWVWKKIMGCQVSLLPHITQDFERQFLWAGVRMQKYSVSAVWRSLCVRRAEVSWWRLVWSTPSIPRYSFISWQIMLDRLPLCDKLISWGLVTDPACCLCSFGLESSVHLFITCPYVASLRSVFFPRSVYPSTWADELSWMSTVFPALSHYSRAANLVWRCMLSHIWKERCRRVFAGDWLDVAQLGRRICLELQAVKSDESTQLHILHYFNVYR